MGNWVPQAVVVDPQDSLKSQRSETGRDKGTLEGIKGEHVQDKLREVKGVVLISHASRGGLVEDVEM